MIKSIFLTIYRPTGPTSPLWQKNSVLKWEGILEKNFHENRVYESVDDNRHILGYISEIDEKKDLGGKGLTVHIFLKHLIYWNSGSFFIILTG